MSVLFTLILLAILCTFIAWLINNKIRQERERKEYDEYLEQAKIECEMQDQCRENEISEHQELIDRLREEYGDSGAEVCVPVSIPKEWDPYRKHFFYVTIFDKTNKILLDKTLYDFKDILGYTIKDKSTQTTITTTSGSSGASTSSVFGRSLVGAVVGGEAGAIIGGSTASRDSSYSSTTKTSVNEDYSVYININDFSNPTVRIDTFDAEALQDLSNILNIIIERNKSL